MTKRVTLTAIATQTRHCGCGTGVTWESEVEGVGNGVVEVSEVMKERRVEECIYSQ